MNDSLRSTSDNLRIVTDQGCDKTISSKMCIAWNSLPLNLRACPSLIIFRKNLKTFYFKIAFEKQLCFIFDACPLFCMLYTFSFFAHMLALSVQ